MREVRAVLALSRRDTAGARRTLASPSSNSGRLRYIVFVRPLTAQVYYALGDYQAALRALADFGPPLFEVRQFDMRWGLLPRMHLLRGAAYERLGRPAEARAEYRQAAAQWRIADAELRPVVEEADRGLARLDRRGYAGTATVGTAPRTP